jgi:hypothetical protein
MVNTNLKHRFFDDGDDIDAEGVDLLRKALADLCRIRNVSADSGEVEQLAISLLALFKSVVRSKAELLFMLDDDSACNET